MGSFWFVFSSLQSKNGFVGSKTRFLIQGWISVSARFWSDFLGLSRMCPDLREENLQLMPSPGFLTAKDAKSAKERKFGSWSGEGNTFPYSLAPFEGRARRLARGCSFLLFGIRFSCSYYPKRACESELILNETFVTFSP